MADLSFRLKMYLYSLLYNNLRNEIAYQYEDAWGSYFESLVVAQDKAMKEQQFAFEKAKAAQDEYQRQVERSFAVLSYFCGWGLGWLGAHLQYRVGPSYFKRYDWDVRESMFGDYVGTILESEDKVAAKMFGDIGKDLGGALVKLGLPGAKNTTSLTAPNAQRITSAATIEEFRKSLKDEIVNTKNRALGMVENIANGVLSDVENGEVLVESLLMVYPEMANKPLAVQEAKGQQMINEWLNDQRRQWAKTWHYFGNDPPPPSGLWITQRHMEKELWVLWLSEHRKDLQRNATDINAERLPWFDSLIDHMVELNLPVMDIITNRGKTREIYVDRLLLWVYNHKPEGQFRKNLGTPRSLPPIEVWTRPR